MEAVQAAARAYGGECVTTKYKPKTEKWSFRCAKGHRFELTPQKLEYEGRWCAKCRKQEMVEKVAIKAKESGGQCTTKQWKHTEEIWTFRCRKGHQLKKKASIVLQNGLHCERCLEEERLEEIREAAKKQNFECLAKRYRGVRQIIRLRCANGHTISRYAECTLANNIKCEKCEKERTERRVKEAARELGWRVLPGKKEGQGLARRWKFKCEAGHTFHRIAGKVLAKEARCESCYQEELLDLIESVARERGGRLVTRSPGRAAKAHMIRCSEGHQFERTGKELLWQSRWCPECTSRDGSAMMKRIEDLAGRNGGRCLSRRYQPAPKKMSFVCRKGHKWRAIGSALVRTGRWCPECRKTPNGEFLEELSAAVKKKGGKLLQRNIEKKNRPVRFECGNGHRFLQIPARIVSNGTWCQRCAWDQAAEERRKGIETARAAAKKRGGRCLSDSYQSAEDYALWRCAEGHEWETKFKTVIYGGSWCPECWRNLQKVGLNRKGKYVLRRNEQRKLKLEDCQRLAEANGGRCISVEYINYRTPLEWKCEVGHEFEATLQGMEQRENFCLKCAEEERREEWLEKAREYAESHRGQCLADEWLDAKERMTWKCERGHVFQVCWNRIKLGPFCGQCANEDRTKEEGVRRLKRLAQSRGGRWIRSEYKGADKPYEFQCSNGEVFKATPKQAERDWAGRCGCGRC